MSSKSTIINAVIPIDRIKPHPENYNQHPDEQIAQLEASYEELGQFNSIVVWKRPGGEYIQVARQGFLTGARNKGATEIRADILPEDTDPMLIKRIMVADNLHAKNSVADEDLLMQLLKEQKDAGYSLASVGSDEEWLRQMLQAEQRAHATDFLSQFTSHDNDEEAMEQQEEEEDATPQGTGTDYFSVTYALTSAQRTTVLTALKKAKQRWNVQTSNAALVQLCQAFLDEEEGED